ncbi:hypothetical protein EMIT0215P_60071 [Pseudomonas serboccidentalis]
MNRCHYLLIQKVYRISLGVIDGHAKGIISHYTYSRNSRTY